MTHILIGALLLVYLLGALVFSMLFFGDIDQDPGWPTPKRKALAAIGIALWPVVMLAAVVAVVVCELWSAFCDG